MQVAVAEEVDVGVVEETLVEDMVLKVGFPSGSGMNVQMNEMFLMLERDYRRHICMQSDAGRHTFATLKINHTDDTVLHIQV